MAWTTPSTQPTGTMITSTHYKTHIIDNLKYLHGPPTVRVSRDALLSVTQSTWFDVTFDVEDWDTNSMWSSTAGTKVFCRTAGKYLVNASGGITTSTGGTIRGIGIRKNSTTGTPEFSATQTEPANGKVSTPAISHLISLTTGQYIQFVLFHDHSGTLNTSTAADAQPRLSMIWMSS
jgi:hypothetical protein